MTISNEETPSTAPAGDAGSRGNGFTDEEKWVQKTPPDVQDYQEATPVAAAASGEDVDSVSWIPLTSPFRICGAVAVSWVVLSHVDGPRTMLEKVEESEGLSLSTLSLRNTVPVEGYLQVVIVLPSHRGRGLGKQLVRACIATKVASLTVSAHPSLFLGSTPPSLLRAASSSLSWKKEGTSGEEACYSMFGVVEQWRLHTLKPPTAIPPASSSPFFSVASAMLENVPYLHYLSRCVTPAVQKLFCASSSSFPKTDSHGMTTKHTTFLSSLERPSPTFFSHPEERNTVPLSDATRLAKIEWKTKDEIETELLSLPALLKILEGCVRATTGLYESLGFTTCRYLPSYYAGLVHGTEMVLKGYRLREHQRHSLPLPLPLSLTTNQNDKGSDVGEWRKREGLMSEEVKKRTRKDDVSPPFVQDREYTNQQ